MSTINTKFNLKQVVYYSTCENKPYHIDCVDCSGTGFWQVSGKDVKVGCHTCNKDEAYWRTPGKVEKYKHFPVVMRLTIGQVRAYIGYDAKVQYMCKETGIGSGSLWNEEELTENEVLAKKVAEILAERRNAGESIKASLLYSKEAA